MGFRGRQQAATYTKSNLKFPQSLLQNLLAPAFAFPEICVFIQTDSAKSTWLLLLVGPCSCSCCLTPGRSLDPKLFTLLMQL